MEEIKKNFEEYINKRIRLEQLGFAPSSENAGAVSGYINALIDTKQITKEDSTEFYASYYNKIL